MLPAETTSDNSRITPFSRAVFLSIMLHAKSSHVCIVAAAFSRAGHFNVVVPTNTSSLAIVVSGARILCADPVRTMLGANKLAKYLRSVAAWCSAG